MENERKIIGIVVTDIVSCRKKPLHPESVTAMSEQAHRQVAANAGGFNAPMYISHVSQILLRRTVSHKAFRVRKNYTICSRLHNTFPYHMYCIFLSEDSLKTYDCRKSCLDSPIFCEAILFEDFLR